MSKAVKAAGLGLVIFVTVWVVTLWQWYVSQKPVNSEEVATQLVLLPVGLTGVALVVWWLAGRLRQWSHKPVNVQLAAAPSPLVASGVETAGQAAADDNAAGRSLGRVDVTILAEAVNLPGADEPELAWAALRIGQVRPGLDPQLHDADGMPVFTSRLHDLSTQDWLDAHADVSHDGVPEAVLRAMALIEAPLHRLLSALPPTDRCGLAPGHVQSDAFGAASGPAFLSGVGQAGAHESAMRRRDQAPLLEIQVWVPAEWAEAGRTFFYHWLRQQAGVALDWARESGSGEPVWSMAVLDSPEAGWDSLLRVMQSWQADERPRLLMVVAAHSLVDDAGVARLQAKGELFTAVHQGGRVPGEAAAGLLLASPRMAATCEGEHPRLGWPVAARRLRSADRAGRTGSGELEAAARQALLPWTEQADATSASRAWWWLSDADHRPSRSSELFEAFQTLQPEGDAMSAVLRIGDAWGDTGVARALVPVALAAAAVRQGHTPADEPGAAPNLTPALVGLTQCSHRRWVIPVWPAGLNLAALEAPPSHFLAAVPAVEPLAA